MKKPKKSPPLTERWVRKCIKDELKKLDPKKIKKGRKEPELVITFKYGAPFETEKRSNMEKKSSEELQLERDERFVG